MTGKVLDYPTWFGS